MVMEWEEGDGMGREINGRDSHELVMASVMAHLEKKGGIRAA